MIQLNRYHLFVVSEIAVICIVAWFFQASFLPNGDVSWDLLGSQRLLAGGTYTHDFFDLNPPLILYLYQPAISLVKTFHIRPILALNMCVFGLAWASLFMCYFFVRRIFLHENFFISYAFLGVLAMTFLIFPVNEIGQREHLLVIFTFPYFLAISYRLQGYTLKNWHAVAIGLFAALGFALKPFFLLPFALVELYTMIYTRNALAWLRAEVISIVFFIVIYTACVFIFHSDYIDTVIPIAMHYYYAGFKKPLAFIFLNDLVGFCLMVSLFYFGQYQKNTYKSLSAILFIAMIGFMGGYAMQQTPWFYHLLPAASMALLLLTILFGLFIDRHQKNIVLIVILAVILFIIPVVFVMIKYSDAILSKKAQEPLIAFLNGPAGHQSVYFISASGSDTFSAVPSSTTIYSSRFMHLFWMPGIVKNGMENSSALRSPQQVHEERFLINLIAEDLDIKKPKYVLVDVKEHKSFFSLFSFEYLPYLLKNRNFQSAWKPYHYLTTLKSRDVLLVNKDVWDLYLEQSLQRINPKKINGNAVILMGEGTAKIAYYVRDHQFLKNHHALFHSQVKLTKHELLQLPKQAGKVDKNRQNISLVNQLVNRSVEFPIYNYQIYQREDITLTGIS